MRSRRFPAGSHLFTFSAFHFHAPALESGLMSPDGLLRLSRRDEIADVFSFLFFYPPRSVTPIIPSRGWRRGGGPKRRLRKFSSPPAAFTRSPMALFCRVSFLDAFFAFSFDLDPFSRINSRAGRNHFWVEARCPTTAGYYFFYFFSVSWKDLSP